MSQVYNWQLGREMEYPYEAHRPKRQFAAVFNLNRCIACQTCTFACKSTWTFSPGQEAMWWNNVETKPFGSYPQHWDVKILKLLGEQPGWDISQTEENSPYGAYLGKTLFEMAKETISDSAKRALGYLPEDKEWRFPNIYEDTSTVSEHTSESQNFKQGTQLPEHSPFFFYLPRICNHCTYPACLSSCPRKAIYKRPEDGIVLIDQTSCRGYRKCVEQCPYKKSMFNPFTRISEKCIGCYPRVEEGIIPRCMAACIGKIRLMGWVDDPQSPIYYLVRKEKVALPLYPQLGLEPNIYYIPPRWVPRGFLSQMFGPGVEEAIKKYSRPSPELLAVLQLFGVTQRIIYSYDFSDDEVVGFDEKKKEINRVPLEEKVLVRPEKHLNTT